MSLPPLACAAMEVALNRYLRLEDAALQDCARLAGKHMEVALPSGGLSAAIEFIEGGVRVLPQAPGKPDVRVCATPTALLSALRSESGLASGVEVEGDTEVLERFRAMLRTVGFDPEEWLQPLLGAAGAHRVGSALSSLFGWTQDNSRRMADHTAEYLREETYDLARGRDVGVWMDDIDRLRDDVDRFEARLSRLEKAPAANGGETG